MFVCVYICMCVCLYVCMCVCMCWFVYDCSMYVRLVVCILEGFAEFQKMQDWIHDIRTTINWFQLVLHLLIETIHHWFQASLHSSNLLVLEALGGHCWSILGSWEITLASIWWSFGARLHSGGLLRVPRWICIDFLKILGALLGPLLGNLLIFHVSWSVKKHVWIAGTIYNDFWLQKLLISDVRTSQKHTKYFRFR